MKYSSGAESRRFFHSILKSRKDAPCSLHPSYASRDARVRHVHQSLSTDIFSRFGLRSEVVYFQEKFRRYVSESDLNFLRGRSKIETVRRWIAGPMTRARARAPARVPRSLRNPRADSLRDNVVVKLIVSAYWIKPGILPPSSVLSLSRHTRSLIISRSANF